MTQPNIEPSTQEQRDFIDSKIVAFNASQLPFSQEEPFTNLSYVIKENGQIVAGINSVLYCWKCLYIDVLWVDESYKNKGYGSLLLRKAEQEAISGGSHLAHLDTFDFQAKDFYLKHGYTIFGTLEDCPLPGHRRYYLQKNL